MPLDQLGQGLLEALSFHPVQVSSAHSDQMGTSGLISRTYFSGPVSPPGPCCTWAMSPLVPGRGSCARCVGLLWSDASAHPVQLVRETTRRHHMLGEIPDLCRCLEQWPGCICLLSLTDMGLFVLGGSRGHREGLSQEPLGTGGCLALG